MAGRGSRFKEAGYSVPKPLIPIGDKTMIELVVNNLRPECEHRFIFMCLKEHIEAYELKEKLANIAPGCVSVSVDKVTEGAACTVLLAKEYINNNDALMLANSDQYVDIDINAYLKAMTHDGLIMTMTAYDKKWSFIRYDKDGFVTEVKEKEPISDEATVGIYNFAKGEDFIRAAERMIKKDIRVNNEFYVAPVYNELIEEGKRIAYYNIGRLGSGMHGLGTPEDLKEFTTGEYKWRKAL
jgi:NDP-sugar pyrophosphorylase family protein